MKSKKEKPGTDGSEIVELNSKRDAGQKEGCWTEKGCLASDDGYPDTEGNSDAKGCSECPSAHLDEDIVPPLSQ